MKQILKTLSLVVLLATLGLTANAQKFGYIYSAEILAGMPEVKQADAALEALQKQLQKKGQNMLTAYQTKVQDLQKKEAAGELSPKQIEDEAVKLREEEQKIATYEQDMVKQINDKRNKELQPIFDKVNTAIKDVATEGGYQYIFDRNNATGSVILYADETQDLTAQVKTKLGIN